MGFGDFRNTPIKLGDSRSESVQPILPENFPENFYPSVQAAGDNFHPAVQAATGKFIQEPTISINLNFPAKNICAFCHLNRKSDEKRIRILRVFLQTICINNVNEKLILKELAGILNCLKYWYSYLSKKSVS